MLNIDTQQIVTLAHRDFGAIAVVDWEITAADKSSQLTVKPYKRAAHILTRCKITVAGAKHRGNISSYTSLLHVIHESRLCR